MGSISFAPAYLDNVVMVAAPLHQTHAAHAHSHMFHISLQIKKAEEVLQESYMMIPDSKNRFQKSLEVSADRTVGG